MIYQLIPNVKLLKEGEDQIIKMIIDNELRALKENYGITLHKSWQRFRYMKMMKNEEITISYVVLESISK